MRCPFRVALFGAIAAACLSSVAHAEEPVLVAPKIVESTRAEDPRAGAAPRAVVELELEIDHEGKVSNARVVQSGGEALDEAALASARRLVFVPASRDGQPVAARIRYQSVFEARQPEPEPEPETAPPPPAPPPPDPPPAPESMGASARIDAPPREVTKRVLEQKDLASIAGTRGDSLRAVELLPGVSRPSAANGNLPILRGANPFDSQVFLEGAPVPVLYHIGGLTSFVHSRVLDVVELQPSNFSVRYGRKMGGVIEVKLRDPRTDGLRGVAEVSFLDSSLLVETPINDKLSVLATARRSNIDAIVNSATSDNSFAITGAPVYWDYQSIVAFKPTDRDRIRLIAYGSSDRLALVLKRPADVDPTLRGRIENVSTFHRVQLGYRHRWDGGSEQNTEITYGREDGVGAFGKVASFDYGVDTVQLRSEWIGVVSRAFRVIAGVDGLGNRFRGNYRGVPLPPGEGDHPSPLSTQEQISTSQTGWSWQPGAYLEAGIRPTPELLIAPGLRADYSSILRRGALDPRLSTRLEVSDTTTLKAGIGKYSQIPFEAEALAPTGNPNLQMPRSLHVSGGFEQKLREQCAMSIEGFVKWMDRITTTTRDGQAPFFDNSQRGRVFGAEALLRFHPTERLSGFASYTLMRSERADAGAAFRLFDRDQTHILALAASYRLGGGWELGVTFRYTSGTPYTPVASSSYDATNDVYVPRLGAAMSARNPAFNRLDLRVQKTWTFSRWSLAVYLDMQNVWNAENREGFSYSYDYRQRQGVRGLPILPILGLRGEL